MQSLLTIHLHQLEALYTFREPPKVVDFLEKHAFLVPLLIEAREQIKSHFPNTPCYLEVPADLEIPAHKELLLSIGTSLNSETAWPLMRQLDRDWWFRNSDRAKGRLVIDVEYQ